MSKGSNIIRFTFKSPCITILNPRMIEHRAGIKRHIFVTNRILLEDFAILVFGRTCPAISTHILLDSAEVVIFSASSHDFSLISTICFSSQNIMNLCNHRKSDAAIFKLKLVEYCKIYLFFLFLIFMRQWFSNHSHRA